MAIGGTGSIIGRFLNNATQALSNSQRKIASGTRTDRASSDAAGMAIAAALSTDAATLSVANRNIGDGMSSAQIADSALSSLSDMTSRMAELATQAANGTYSDEQRASMKAEYDALAAEAQRTIETTSFNGQNLFSGSGVTIQAGTGGDSNSQISIGNLDISQTIQNMSSVDIGTQAGATSGLDVVTSSTEQIASVRGQVGASVSRLETASANNSSMQVEELSAKSAIVDLDIADETAKSTAASIRQNVSTAIMAQANQSSTMVQRLLG